MHQVCAVGALHHLFYPLYSKTEASKQTIGLLEATDPEHRARPQAGLPWTFPGLEYRCWPPWRPKGGGDGQQTQRSCAKHMPPGGAGRRASIEVEETSESRQTKSHQCTWTEHLSPGWDEVDRPRPSHEHAQLPPAQGDRFASRALGPAKLHTSW